MSTRPLPARLALPTVVLFGAGYPLGSATVEVMSPFLVVLLRFVATAAFLWILISIRRPALPTRRQVGHAVIAGLLAQGMQFLCMYWGLSQGVSSVLAALVIALNPVLTVALLVVCHHHRVTGKGMVALMLAVGAVVLACAPRLVEDPHIGVAIVAIGLALTGVSLGGIHQSRHCAEIDPWVSTAIGATASAPLAAIATAATETYVYDWPKALVLVGSIVVLTSIGAITLYAACLTRAGAQGASVLFAVIPAVASVLSWVFLGESLTAWTGIALVLGATACVVQANAGRRDRLAPGELVDSHSSFLGNLIRREARLPSSELSERHL